MPDSMAMRVSQTHSTSTDPDVVHLQEHYGYEQIRAVHTLSAMWAATGGHPLAHSAVKLAEALKTFDVEAKSVSLAVGPWQRL